MIRKCTWCRPSGRAPATIGIWAWTYEEPLSQMCPPDWNWADFIGVSLELVRHPSDASSAAIETGVDRDGVLHAHWAGLSAMTQIASSRFEW